MSNSDAVKSVTIYQHTQWLAGLDLVRWKADVVGYAVMRSKNIAIMWRFQSHIPSRRCAPVDRAVARRSSYVVRRVGMIWMRQRVLMEMDEKDEI